MRPFDGCRQRLRRAKVHRNAIADMWREFATQEGAYTVTVRVEDDGTGGIWMSPIEDKGLFNVIALQFGEMLYQIRAALDGCVYQAAILETGKTPPPNEQDLAFPICETKADFSKKAARNLSSLTEERRKIVEKVQPYNTPNLAPDELVFNFNRALVDFERLGTEGQAS